MLISAGANVDAIDHQNMSVIDKARKTPHAYAYIVDILKPLISTNNRSKICR